MQNPQNKSKAAAGFLSVVAPGSGHLYLGLNKLGIQLMVLFFGALVLHLPFTTILLPVVWFYALFDALQKTDRYNQWVDGERRRLSSLAADRSNASDAGPDQVHNTFSQTASHATPASVAEALGDRFWFDWPSKSELNVPMWVGVLIVVIGGYTLLSAFFPNLSFLLGRMHLGSIVVALVLIGFGLRMIWQQKRSGDHD